MNCIGCNKSVVSARSYCTKLECFQIYQISSVDDILVTALKDKKVLEFILKINIAAGKLQSNRQRYLFENLPTGITIPELTMGLIKYQHNFHKNIIKLQQMTEEQLKKHLGDSVYICMRYITLVRFRLSSFEAIIDDSNNTLCRYDVSHGGSTEAKFRGKQVMYLFHGSAIHNWGSILRNGLKTTNKDLLTNGAAHGSGIYMTKTLATAYRYSNNNCIVALCELDAECDKYSKDWCHVIPDESLVLVRSLIEISSKQFTANGKKIEDALLQLYHKNADVIAKNISNMQNRRKVRLSKEIAQLEDNYHVAQVTLDNGILDCTLVSGDNNIRVYLGEYPFRAPIIHLLGRKNASQSINEAGVYLFDALGNWSACIKLPALIVPLITITLRDNIIGNYPDDADIAKESVKNIIEIY